MQPATSGSVALPPSAQQPPLQFSFPEVTGGELSSEKLRGRITVIGLITTYDLPSQAQVRHLSRLAREHVPRLNVALLVLEPPENRELVALFAGSLSPKLPVGMADAATTRGEGPFAGLHHVPSVVILDRDGRERFRYLGLLEQDKLDAAVVDVEKAVGPPK